MKNVISKVLKQSLAGCFCLAIFTITANSQIASGGNYTLTQTVNANGGASGSSASLGGNYTVEGTIGQNAAGTQQQNASFKFQPGFWTAEPFGTTAAEVTVGGRILAANGSGVKNVFVSMTGANGETRLAISNSFGYYRFENVFVGETYIFTVAAKQFSFKEPTIIRSILDDMKDINFIAFDSN